MGLKLKSKDIVNVTQYVTDKKGRKVAAILDMNELLRIQELLEDSSDLKAIEDRISEPAADYEVNSRKRKARLHV